jgi:hypothetical protein
MERMNILKNCKIKLIKWRRDIKTKLLKKLLMKIKTMMMRMMERMMERMMKRMRMVIKIKE